MGKEKVITNKVGKKQSESQNKMKKSVVLGKPKAPPFPCLSSKVSDIFQVGEDNSLEMSDCGGQTLGHKMEDVG